MAFNPVRRSWWRGTKARWQSSNSSFSPRQVSHGRRRTSFGLPVGLATGVDSNESSSPSAIVFNWPPQAQSISGGFSGVLCNCLGKTNASVSGSSCKYNVHMVESQRPRTCILPCFTSSPKLSFLITKILSFSSSSNRFVRDECGSCFWNIGVVK